MPRGQYLIVQALTVNQATEHQIVFAEAQMSADGRLVFGSPSSSVPILPG